MHLARPSARAALGTPPTTGLALHSSFRSLGLARDPPLQPPEERGSQPALPYLTLPYLTLPYLALPYFALPYLTLPYLAYLDRQMSAARGPTIGKGRRLKRLHGDSCASPRRRHPASPCSVRHARRGCHCSLMGLRVVVRAIRCRRTRLLRRTRAPFLGMAPRVATQSLVPCFQP